MNLKRLLLIALPLCLGIGLWLGYRVFSGPADVIAAFEVRCLVPMAQGSSPDLSELQDAPGFEPEGIAKQAGLLSGTAIITHNSVQDPKSEGCIVTDTQAPLLEVKDQVAAFESWANAAIQTGSYTDIENCSDDENAYYRVLNTVPAEEGDVPVRIVMTAFYPEPYYALTAATGAEMVPMCS